MRQITKRNGEKVKFDKEKIKRAISLANAEVDEDEQVDPPLIQKIADTIGKYPKNLSVEEIQDMVEDSLWRMQFSAVARHYTNYRYIQSMKRQSQNTDESILALVRNENAELKDENSNKDSKIASTQRDYIAGEVSRDLTRRILLPQRITEAHDDGVFHFHDADYFVQPIFNCCLINIKDMLDNGTVMNGKLIESPKSFQVACTVMTQIIACVASNQYGGQSVDVSHLGKYLHKSRVKIKKRIEEETEKFKENMGESYTEMVDSLIRERLASELSAGVQTIQYQINTLMTTNGQSPFVTLFLNLREDDEYLEDTALIVSEILTQRFTGIKNQAGVYITPAFPKLVYPLYEHNCLNGGDYDHVTKLAVQCSAKRMYPDYISAKKMSENYEGNVFSPMGCRSFLSPWKDADGEYQFEGRFNQGVVSLNLPQIGLIVGQNEDDFWKLLENRLELCFEALMCRHNNLKKAVSDVSPIHWQYGAIARLKKGESIEHLLYDGYSSISLGYIGVYELTKLVIGESHTTEKGKKFALDVLRHLKETTERWKAETNIGFGLYGTPAESICYRFAKIDREKFGDIEDITDKGYYTNSYHIDVREEINAFDKFLFEAEFQPLSTGGCISYVEIPNMSHNLVALEDMVRFIYDNIQYAEFNSKSDYCMHCGFDGEMFVNDSIKWECPNCGNNNELKLAVTRRTCGYLGENFWNEGKTKEIKNRYVHL